jgi:hypothetical protein
MAPIWNTASSASISYSIYVKYFSFSSKSSIDGSVFENFVRAYSMLSFQSQLYFVKVSRY